MNLRIPLVATVLALSLSPVSARWGRDNPTKEASASTTTTKTAEPTVAALIDQLKALDVDERLDAVRKLGTLGAKAKDALPALTTALGETSSSDHPAVRQASKEIARSLHSIDPGVSIPSDVLNRFVKRAKIPASRQRVQGAWIPQCAAQVDAIETLGLLGSAARSALPELVQLSRKPCVQGAAGQVIAQIGSPTADQATHVLRSLQDPDAEVRQGTLDFAASLDPATPGLVLAVARALNDPAPGVRLAALETIEKLHPEGEGRLPLVAPFLKEPSRDLRERAIQVIALMGPGARAAVPSLESALSDSEVHVRLAAARVLRRIDPRNPKLIETLAALGKDPSGDTAEAAAEVLRQLDSTDPRVARALLPYQQKERRLRAQKAWSESTPQQREFNARSLRVQSIRMAAEIVGDQPSRTDRSFPSFLSPLYCWTEVAVSTPPAGIHHVWYFNGQKRSDQFVEVIAPVDRLWTREAVKPGKWKVEVRSDVSSEPLATINFSVYEEVKPTKPTRPSPKKR